MAKTNKEINPNSDKEYIDKLDLANEHNFPIYLKKISLSPFRHIQNLEVSFAHPISVIAGTNRSGKSTILIAIACSHLNFKKRNVHNGKLERQTWNSIMQFTNHDKQVNDWTYYITYKLGKKEEIKRGQRKADTKKWNGIGKKESQLKHREVAFLDLDRILPARNFGKVIFSKAQKSTLSNISNKNVGRIEKALSYILEENFTLKKVTGHLDKDIFKYNNTNEYSSYNAATGEEVLTKLIIEAIEAPSSSLVLIDEIEVGLHPKIQRRLIDVIYNIARNDSKQFIITSHSPTILSSVPDKARIFIEKTGNNKFRSIPNISVNGALSKMDSISYPLIDLYCEDQEAKKIIEKAISSIQKEKSLKNFSNLINIIISGSGKNTFSNFKAHQNTYPFKKIKTGYACILDGDRKTIVDNGSLAFPPEECLHFIYSNESPEKFLTRAYIEANPNATIKYHIDNSNPHCLFDKMVENSICVNRSDAFETCWNIFKETTEGKRYFIDLKNFILKMCQKFSPDL